MVHFSTLGRIIGVLGVAGMPVYALYSVFTGGMEIQSAQKGMGVSEAFYFGGMTVVLGIIELPMLCSCYEWCKVLTRITRPIAGLWVGRGIIHLLIAAGMLAIAVHEQVKNTYVFIFGSAFVLSALFYFIGGLYKREPGPFAGSDQAVTGASKGAIVSSSSAASAGSFFGGIFAKKVAENPEAATAFVSGAVGAAAPSAGALLFGGSSSSSSSSSSSGSGSSRDSSPKESAAAAPTGFYGSESAEAPADKASMFTGGGLFGGGASGNNSASAAVSKKAAKYGSSGDDFESAANPFMS